TYEGTITLKRRRDDEDKDEEPSAGSNLGSKRRRAGKEPESTSAPKEKTSKTIGKSTEGSKSHHKSASESAPTEDPMHTTKDLEELTQQEFDTCATDDQPIEEASQHPDWFQKQAKPPTPDRAWNKTLPATHGPIQPWINNLARKYDSRTSFNELMDTPLDFSAFMINQLKVVTLTLELLDGPTYELMKGSCKSLVELEFFLEEIYKATTDQLEWNNPEDDEDKDEEPSAGSNLGSKRRRAGKEPESTSAPKEKTSKTIGKSTEGSKSHYKSASESAPAEDPMHTTKDLEELTQQEFDTCATDDQPIEEASQHPDWFQKQAKPPTPDRAWNKTLPATHGPIQPWINNLARKDDSRTSFNELMDTPLDFSAFMINQLKVVTLTLELLDGPTYELMKGSCKSLVELEFFLEEIYKAT
nr:hypothetical protein [Tanacetum cinerariifolium]